MAVYLKSSISHLAVTVRPIRTRDSVGTALWRFERTANRGFPFRISIEQDGRLVIAVRAKAVWPGPGQNIFCLREHEADAAEPLHLIERVLVASLVRIGRKLTVVLDRPQRKRCEFGKLDGTPRAHAIEQRSQQAPSRPRDDESGRNPERSDPCALAQHQSGDTPGRGAQREPDTELTFPLGRG